MSADNGIYILVTPHPLGRGVKEFRVRELMAIDNLNWDEQDAEVSNDPDLMILNARRMWEGAFVFTDRGQAHAFATDLIEENFTEYGVVEIPIDRIFYPNYTSWGTGR